MKKLVCALLIVALMAGVSFADGREERYVREEASRRGITLITEEEAVRIARERAGSKDARVKDVDLEDEDDYYRSRDDFRPVWSLEAVAGGQEYDIDVDAVTGEILKFKLDD
ncbi:MAG: PepSY domain-containing protein [Synergistaceae bacterium]|nr:PepSY domain-containing protein [Synergistaceae bacterium]